MNALIALLAGLLFGIGLIVSGMSDPSRVLGFLDIAGSWNPSLAFVMAGAVLVALAGFGYAAGRGTTLLGGALHMPQARAIDRRLVLGGVAFGIGWGLAGFCPGPALASLAGGGAKPLIFCAAMVAGMVLFDLLERLPARRQPAA